MTFKEKIDKILENNKLGINSVSGMEEFLGLGRGSINKKYSKNEYPGNEVIKTIKDVLRISGRWWETGEGGIFVGEEDRIHKGSQQDKLHESIYRDLVEANTEYRLVPKTILNEEYRILLKSEIDDRKKLLDEVITSKNTLIEQLKQEIMELRSKAETLSVQPKKT